jgi:hypothetical protein
MNCVKAIPPRQTERKRTMKKAKQALLDVIALGKAAGAAINKATESLRATVHEQARGLILACAAHGSAALAGAVKAVESEVIQTGKQEFGYVASMLRRIAAGLDNAELLPLIVKAATEGKKVQDIAELCPKVKASGRPKGTAKQTQDAGTVVKPQAVTESPLASIKGTLSKMSRADQFAMVSFVVGLWQVDIKAEVDRRNTAAALAEMGKLIGIK